ncbi:MAG TPA: type II CAAX endopeptidase family protein, partial [Gemmataceae bacterium]|nr:type II CAAX endopeptidase family protein [Gemmataceae bacterium]
GLLFAKYVSVVTVAVLTAVVNLATMTVTLLVFDMGRLVFPEGLRPLAIVQVFFLLLLFAAFFSAVLLAVTSFARSFKEAQAYLIPLMLVSLAPGLIGMMPGLKLEGLYAVTPLLNIVLLARDLLDAKAAVEPALAAVVILSTSVYALAAIALAARIFGAEGVLYSEQGNWSDLFRRPARPRATPTLTSALGCLALLFPAYFVVASLLRWAPLEERQWLQVLATFVLFALLPLLAAFRGRVRVVSAFRLRGGTWIAYPAAVLLGLGLVPVVYEMLAVLRAERLTFFGREQEEQFRKQFEQWRTMSPWLLAGGLAIVGMLEELFFRGYLFSALRSVGGAALTILGSALLFGLFHAPQAFDRLLPSTLLGVVLGWVCWRSGSVLPGMLLHAVYNALPILLVYYNPPTPGESAHWPLEWLGAGFAGVVTGAALLLASGGRKLPDNSENQGA